jgi:hypothetical protein
MPNTGIMSSRSALGGTSDRPAATLGNYAPSDSILLSPADPPFPRSNFLQTVFDVLALASFAVLLCASGIGLGLALYVLFFVRL